MLADRDYMREPARSEPMRLTTKLIIANVVCFIIFAIILDPAKNPRFQEFLYLSKDGLAHGYVWQLLTFQFLHSGFIHLLFNCVGIYSFGRLVEERMSGKRFLQLYLTAGVLGGIAQILGGLVIAKFAGPIVGASAGVFVLISAFALMFWHQRFKVLLFFFIPVELSGRIVFWASLVISLISLVVSLAVTTKGPEVAHLAHLGGFFTVFLFLNRYGEQVHLGEWMSRRAVARPAQTLVNAGSKPASWRKAPASTPEEEPSADFISKEVDPILDKISSKGIHSLTEQERKILEKARSKMAKR
jgi:membrane associated rhomboid family serine protease